MEKIFKIWRTTRAERLNVIVESLKLIQESVVSMCKCQSTMFELVYLVCKMGRKRLAEFPIIIIETYIQ